MPKLPKSMQKKKQAQKEARTSGSPKSTTTKPASKAMNRQMRRRMEQQGVEGMEEIPATRVLIETDEGDDLVIEGPQVIKVVQQGMEVYQVIGSANPVAKGTYGSTTPAVVDEELYDEEESSDDDADSGLDVSITEQDIQLVAMQTGVSPEVAEATLKDCNGDLARAILNLKSR